MKYYFFFAALSLVSGGLAYAISDHYGIGIGVFVLFLGAGMFFMVPSFLKFEEKERKRHECYRFINAFIISLSVNLSGEKAYEDATATTVGEERALIDRIVALKLLERLEYLKTYFAEGTYRMFVSIFRLFSEQGGDVLTLADPLLKEATRNEEYGNARLKIKIAGLAQFLALWFMSYLVLAFIRFGLNNFYLTLASSLAYLGTAMAYFGLALISFLYFTRKWTEERFELRRKKNEPAY